MFVKSETRREGDSIEVKGCLEEREELRVEDEENEEGKKVKKME